jgi:translation initiation factor 1
MSKRQTPGKISTSGPQSPIANPFASLAMTGLPESPTTDSAPAQRGSAQQKAPKSKGRVVLRRETAHRGGKAVVVVTAIPSEINAPQIQDLAKKLRSACGAGGTVRDREIEIQGDQVGRVRAFLEGAGFRVDGERN